MEFRAATLNSLAKTSTLEARLWLGDRDLALLAIASFVASYSCVFWLVESGLNLLILGFTAWPDLLKQSHKERLRSRF